MKAVMSVRFIIVVIFKTLTDADLIVGWKSVLNKHTIGPNDEFVIECDVAKFSLILVPPFRTIMGMVLERKLDFEENYTQIAAFFPFSDDNTRTQKTLPKGRYWEYEFKGTNEFSNKDTIQIKVHVKDASCSDVGLYRCSLAADSLTQILYTKPASLQNTETIQQGYLTMIPTSGHSLFFSKNKVGDRIVLGCTLTGPLDLKVTWSYTTKKVPGREIEFTMQGDIMHYPPESALDCNSCRTHFYMTTLKFTMTASNDGNTYYCSATDGFGLNTKANFTVFVE